MEATFNDLASHCIELLESAPADQRVLIAVSGIPGSGKTTLGNAVYQRVNNLWNDRSGTRIAAFVPMDGFHLTRETLASMPNAEEAIARRGAPFTFDPNGLLLLVEGLRRPLDSESKSLFAPSFDHAVKDPVEDDIEILPTDRIVIIEGNYLHLQDEPWHQIAGLMDELWFVRVEREIARQRIIHRHIEAGIAKDEGEAAKRADENDLVNGDYIIQHSLTPHRIIISIQDKLLI
ncbi:P-loop containing nucleoside triphosphate hydrolase protein [Lipomyces tetrasporus]|uniref:P-loop containing nucleoside triphosphate hydrolase protein n=1 Tax=Lipomyces tetrasporus TaxID=54092 RepID=A0AAD7VUV0_9ASCO|nr:P-loop containing nucleoside triphosphate hydrolase protein [Lipomyces tetrasporus]KAJ8103522.1 P-loop containing nucleoside triphosphate hydrolase protein [Lipomyces tetrasporus]